MGNDGGSIPKRDDLVKTKDQQQVESRRHQEKESTRWNFCSLSKRPLEEPIVSDRLGKLYNKSCALEYLLDKHSFGEDGRQVAGHVESMRDIVDLKMTRNLDRSGWICPISLKELGQAGSGRGEQRWVYLNKCGCVLTEAGLRQVEGKECPVCGAERIGWTVLNPNQAEEEQLRIKLAERRKIEAEEKLKRKLERKEQKKRKVESTTTLDDPSESAQANQSDQSSKSKSFKKPKTLLDQQQPSSSKSASGPSSNIHSTSISKLTQEIHQEAQQNLTKLSSSTISSIYGPRDKDGKQLLGQQKESWMTRGTWTRYAA